jgi:GMP synthase (glutamine-hydrolysing)
MARILIFDGAPAKAQQAIAAHGGLTNPQMFEQALSRHERGLEFFPLNVADGERLPQGMAVGDFDGVVITGSPLSVYKPVPAVTRQIDLAREVFASGVPAWGSCWGLQLMTAALGGVVRESPQGGEIGIARNITLGDSGHAHPLFAGKARAFDALCWHRDEVESLPQGATVLAANAVSEVQAVEIADASGSFLGVQYHPEHTFSVSAAIMEAHIDRLVAEGFERLLLQGMIADLRALEADPGRHDVAWRLGLDRQVVDPALRTAEFGNWLRAKVLPRRAERLAAA